MRAKVAKLAFRFDVRDYGAKAGDGVDDHAYIQAAVTAALAAGGGTVFFGPGIYDISTGISVTSGTTPVSFEGADATTTIRAQSLSTWDNDNLEPMLKIPGPETGLGNRLGFVRNLKFDGNNLAPVGLHLYALVEWGIHNVDIEDCERVGKIEDGIQNCTFVGNKVQKCGSGTTKGTDTGANLAPFDDAQVVVDHGAANNHHYFEQLSATDPAQPNEAIYNLIICQSSTSAIITGYPPHSNVWHGAQIERSATSSLGAVLQSSGILNTISDATMFVAGSRRFVTVTRQADTGPGGGGVDAESGTLTLRDCRFSGESSGTPILIKANTTSGEAVILVNPSLVNIDVFAEASDQANIRLEGSIVGAEPATWLTNILDWESAVGSNDETATSLITRTIAKSPVFPTGEPPNGTNWGTSFFVTNHQVQSVFHNGQWRNTFYNPTTRTNLPYSTSVTPSATEGTYQSVTVTDGVAWTLNQPPSTLPGKLLCLEIYNNSGGAMGTVTFNGVYDLDATWSAPATGSRVILFFVCDGTNWREVGRQPQAGGFTNPMTTTGDLILGGSGGTAGRLGIGSNGQVLKSNGTTAVWGTDSTGAGGGIATVKTNGTTIDTDISILDFSSEFTAAQSPDQEVNVDIAAAITRDAEWDTSAEIATAVGDETGSGALVFGTSPTLTTPTVMGALTLFDVGGAVSATLDAEGQEFIWKYNGATILQLSDAGAFTFADGVRQTFNPNGTAAGVNVGSQAGDPSTPANGDLWYDSTANELTARINGASVALGVGLTAASIDTSAELNAIVTDNTGSGALVFGTSPTLSTNVVVTGGTSTDGTSLISGTQTWNEAGTTWYGLDLAFTDSASGSGTRPIRVRVDGSTIFAVSKTGSLTLGTDLPVSEGGTGASTLTGLLKGNGASAFTAIAPGTGVETALAAATNATGGLVTRGVVSTTSGATLTPTGGHAINYAEHSAQAEALTIAAPSGTPAAGHALVVCITDNGTARALTWNSAFQNEGEALPTTTTLGKTLRVGFIYSAKHSKWGCVAVKVQP